jgi:hypothetical protein
MKNLFAVLLVGMGITVHAETMPDGYVAVDGSFFDQIIGQANRERGLEQVLAILNSGAVFTAKVGLYSADETNVPIVRPHLLLTAGCVANRLDGGLPIVFVSGESLKVKTVRHGIVRSFETWDFIFENGLWLQCYDGWFSFAEDIGQAFEVTVPLKNLKDIVEPAPRP